MPRQIRAVGCEEVFQILRNVQYALAVLKSIGRGELKAVRKPLIHLDQERLIPRRRAWPPEIDRAGGALGSGVVCLCPRACRDGRSADRIKVIEVDAGAKKTARCPMDHMPEDVVSSKQNI